jgi:hypothetical protein
VNEPAPLTEARARANRDEARATVSRTVDVLVTVLIVILIACTPALVAAAYRWGF